MVAVASELCKGFPEIRVDLLEKFKIYDRMIRVLYITHYVDMLGANKSMLQLIIELRKYGINPAVVLPEDRIHKNGLKKYLVDNKIEFYECEISMIKHPKWWWSPINYLHSLYSRKKILEKLRGLKFDLVHSNSSVVDIGAYIAHKKRIPHVWHLREFGDLDYDLKTPFGKWFQSYIYKNSSTYIAISKSIFDHYKAYIDENKINLIYNGIKTQPYSNRSVKQIVNFCIIGLLHKNKGQINVLRATKLLVDSGIKDFHVNIIGGGQKEYVEELQSFTRNQGIESMVTFLGERDDVPKILSKMDVGIMASYNEAFGRVTVEYMMSGLAVIASDGGANREVIEDGISGLIYQAGNIDELAKKMKELILNHKTINYLSENGYDRAIKLFSSERNAADINKLYKQLVKTN